MRKLGPANIRAFVIFSIIVLCVIAIFVYGITIVLSYDKNIYTVTFPDYTYDEGYSPISITEKGTINQSWDGNYYLNMMGNHYNLGTEPVVYNPNDYRMYAYGNVYQLFEDGTVEKKSGQTEIVRNAAASFFKLADRKYLMVDKEIIDKNKDLYVKNYLVVILDKQGNALLVNNEINMKTLNSIILKSANFSFDVANEKLNFNGKEIDLKKVIGSTNEYTTNKGNTNSNNDSNTNNTGGNSSINVGSNGSSSDATKVDFQKRVSLRTVNPDITYIDIEYSVVDPTNTYDTVFLLLSDGVNTSKIQLNKDEISYRIRNLKPNCEYTVSIGYTYKDQNNDDSLTEKIQDVVAVRTAKPNYNLAITKVTGDKVYFNLKLDASYNLESGLITLYSDKVKIDSINIDTKAAIASGGWQGYIDMTNPGYEILLKLENTVYNGNNIDVSVQAKYINY